MEGKLIKEKNKIDNDILTQIERENELCNMIQESMDNYDENKDQIKAM